MCHTRVIHIRTLFSLSLKLHVSRTTPVRNVHASRRERGSRSKNSGQEQESVFARRRRRIPSSSSTTSSPLTDQDAMRYNLSPPPTPTTKSGSNNSSTNEVLLASLKLPVQMVSASAIQMDVHTAAASPLNLTSDLSDIPYIEDAETNNGYRSSSITSITAQPQQPMAPPPPQQQPQPQPQQSIAQSKSLSAMTKKSGFPLTKIKSQFKPAQLTLSAVPIDQGTKVVDKQAHHTSAATTAKPSASSTIDAKPHSVPMMTGI